MTTFDPKIVTLNKDYVEMTGKDGQVEYYFTLDATKEIAMATPNEIGKQVRRYFIEMEMIAREKFGAKSSIELPEEIAEMFGIKANKKSRPYLNLIKDNKELN